VSGESAERIWGAFAGIFGAGRLNNRSEVGEKSLKIMAMFGDSGTDKPCLMGDVPPLFLLNCVCDFICVKHSGRRTEQAYFDWIKTLHPFPWQPPPGPRPGSTYGTWAECLNDRSLPTSADQWLSSAMWYNRSCPIVPGSSAVPLRALSPVRLRGARFGTGSVAISAGP
jgi:hypothetical protein